MRRNSTSVYIATSTFFQQMLKIGAAFFNPLSFTFANKRYNVYLITHNDNWSLN